MKIRNLIFIAVMTALLSVLSPISIPIGTIPITLATLLIYLIGGIFPFKISVPIVLFYIIIGAIGFPVFAGFNGGIGMLMGPTGGYIIGYLFSVMVQSLIVRNKESNYALQALSMVIGTILIYLIGTTQFILITKGTYSLEEALLICVLPFTLGDAIKIVIATILTSKLRKVLTIHKLV